MSLKKRIQHLEKSTDLGESKVRIAMCCGDEISTSHPEDQELVNRVKMLANGGMAMIIEYE